MLADEELMTLIRVGDLDAFELVYDRHCDAAFSLAYRMCGRRASAEDILQDAFLALWREGALYDGTRESVRSWVLRIVHTCALRNDLAAPGPALDGRPATGAQVGAPPRSKRAAMASVRAEVERVQGRGMWHRPQGRPPAAACEWRLRSWAHLRWGC